MVEQSTVNRKVVGSNPTSGAKYLVVMPFKVTPVPIPNTMVKLLWADGTARAAVWESRLSLDSKDQRIFFDLFFMPFFTLG